MLGAISGSRTVFGDCIGSNGRIAPAIAVIGIGAVAGFAFSAAVITTGKQCHRY